MKKCKYCQSEIDNKAKICPNCRKKQGLPKWVIFLIVIFVFVVIIATTSGGKETKNDENNTIEDVVNDYIENELDTSSNDTKVEEFSYTIDSSYSNGFSYYIEGTVTNNKDKDYSYVSIEFVCYDANGNNLGTAMDNTSNLLGNETWKYKAMGLFSDEENVDHCDFREVTGW